MNTVQVDVAIIGAGTAGIAAYRAAKAAGATAAIVEGGPYGTTCARIGCMPSKLFIAAAEAAHALERAPAFGVHFEGGIRVDGREVMERVRRERDGFVGFVLGQMERMPKSDRIRGNARFVNDHTLEVDGQPRITAGMTVARMLEMPFYHPVVEEGLRTALHDLNTKLRAGQATVGKAA